MLKIPWNCAGFFLKLVLILNEMSKILPNCVDVFWTRARPSQLVLFVYSSSSKQFPFNSTLNLCA